MSSGLAEPMRRGPAGEHAMVIFAIKWSKCHFDTALGLVVSRVVEGELLFHGENVLLAVKVE
jgi:hypothetical protein